MKIKLNRIVVFDFKKENLINLLILIILTDLFLQTIPSWIFFAIIMSFHIRFLNKYENAFLFILFTSILAGAFFQSQNILGLGGFFIPLGLLLILKDIFRLRYQLLKGYFPLFLIFILLGFSAYLNSGGDYYPDKFYNTFIYGTMSFIAFAILFINRDKVRFSILGQIFILWAIFLLRLVIDINQIPGPSALFDFGFMREQTYAYGGESFGNPDNYVISYHLPGFIALMGLSIFLTDIKGNSKRMISFVWLMTLIIIFYSGARQNIVVFIALLIFYVYTLDGISLFKRNLAVIMICILSAIAILSIDSDSIKNIIFAGSIEAAADATGRSVRIGRGLELFNSSPLFGVGFGHYDFMGDYERFPHNIFVELFAEVGLVGFFIISFFIVRILLRYKRTFKYFQEDNFKPYLIFLPLFIRAMVSGSLTTNIIVISFIFSIQFFNFNNEKPLSVNEF